MIVFISRGSGQHTLDESDKMRNHAAALLVCLTLGLLSTLGCSSGVEHTVPKEPPSEQHSPPVTRDTISAETAEALCVEISSGSFDSVTILGDFQYPVSARGHEFSSCIFEGDVSFDGCVLTQRVLFQDCLIKGDFSFKGTSISGQHLGFHRTVFAEKAEFDDSEFDVLLCSFDSVVFADSTSFRGTRFCAELPICFRSVLLSAFADFKMSEFTSEVYFNWSRLRGKADFVDAVFCDKAQFFRCYFDGYAEFTNVDFRELVTFRDSRFRGVGLGPANYGSYSGSFLMANLPHGNFVRCDVSHLLLELEHLSDELAHSLAQASGLSDLSFLENPGTLSELQRHFDQNGYRRQSRELVCAIWRHDANLFETVFFDLTIEFGSNRYRPFKILGILWVVFSIAYSLILRLGRNNSLILVSPPPVWLNTAKASKFTQLSSNRLDNRPSALLVASETRKLLFWASIYSLMSASNFGFRDLNMGSWIRRLSKSEFDIVAYGWIRVVSGTQAGLSVYLVALWFVSLFDNPFR